VVDPRAHGSARLSQQGLLDDTGTREPVTYR
jgi:hypothetical protein